MKMLRSFGCLFLVLGASAAWADEAELVEKVVVRNRLFDVGGRVEVGLSFGFSMLPRLVEHYNFTAAVAYNIAGVGLAVELRLGYAYSQHTGLANQVAKDFASKPRASGVVLANGCKSVCDLAGLWEMTASGLLGVRWQPVYGKINLMAELPVHFQAYVWAGGGAAWLKRESVVICNHKTGSTCDEYFTESKPGAVVGLALGLRFFLGQQHAVKFEVRDYSYFDSYFENVNLPAALVQAGKFTDSPGNGNAVASPGWIDLVQFDLGYTFIF